MTSPKYNKNLHILQIWVKTATYAYSCMFCQYRES